MIHRREAILATLILGTLLLAVAPAVASGSRGGAPSGDRLGVNPDALDIRGFGDSEAPAPVATATVPPNAAAASSREYVEGEVVVTFLDGGSTLASAQSRVHSRVGGDVEQRVAVLPRTDVVSLPDGVSVEDGVAEYEAQPEVASAQPNYVYSLAEVVPDDTMFGWQYGLNNIGQTDGTSDADVDAPVAWQRATGSVAVTVAVIDSGVDATHPDLAANLVPGWDFVDGDADPEANHWHGSHVAGTIGAVGDNARGVSGVCWNVKIMPLKAFDNTGNATSANLAAAITYAAAHGADIINASWGGYGSEDAMVKAAITAVPDVLFVAAAGNGDDTPGDDVGDNTDVTPYYPAGYDLPNILAVAATDDQDALASFSNFGLTSVDVAAPGVQILSATPTDISWFLLFNDDFPLATAGGWRTDDYVSKPWATTAARSDTAPRSMAHRMYDANEESYLDLRYPLDLSHSTSATAIFEIWAELEGGSDFLVPIASTTGDPGDWDVVGGTAWSGSTGGSFLTEFLNLEEYLGETTVYLAFVLESDSDQEYEGVYIDNFDVFVRGGYGLSSGTSMATPHAAGLAALLRSASPTMTVAETKSVIISTCDAKPGLAGKVVSGGRINAASAMATLPDSPDTTPPTTTDDAPLGWQVATATVTLDATDTVVVGEITSGVAATFYSLNGSAPITYTVPMDVSADGTHTIAYRSVDYAGNSEDTQTATVLIDRSPPVTTSDAAASYLDTATITLGATDALSGVDVTHYQLDGGVPVTYTAPIAVAAYGDYTLEFSSSDTAGNAEATQSETFTIGYSDTHAPSTTHDALGGWQTTTVTVTLNATDAAGSGEVTSGVEATYYGLNGSALTTYTTPIEVSAEGANTVAYRSVDFAGNAEVTRTATVLIDSTPPTTTSDAQPSYEDSATITLAATDTHSGVASTHYRLDGSAPITYTAPIDAAGYGDHTLEYYSTDVAGNTESAGTDLFSIGYSDTLAPATSDDAPVGWRSTPATVTLSANDTAGSGEITSGVEATYYGLNGSVLTTYTTPIEVSAEGTTTLQYRSVDFAGNAEVTRTATVLIDSTPPLTTSDAVASYEDSATITLAATDACTGVANTYYRLDGSAPTTYTTPIDATGYGDHTLEFFSTDVLGNVEVTRSVGFSIGHSDTLAPTTTDDAPAAWGSSPVYVRLSASDAARPGEFVSGVAATMYTLDGSAPAAYTAPIRVSAEGGHEIRYWSLDVAGNAETPRSVGFFVTQTRVERVASSTRFSTAVQIAREGWAGGGSDWTGVTDIVIASGDDRAAADPLAAAGLCWAYDAPLFLVSAGFTPGEVTAAVREIAADNPGGRIGVHIVGGPVSVPDARYNDIARAVGASRLSKDRLLSSGGRFDMAAKIAREMQRVSGATPDTVLVANGADSTKFFDALALSPIAAANGYPVLLVNETSVPGATRVVVDAFRPSTVIVGGGPATVSEGVRRSLSGARWSGGDRYSTATTIASRAISSGILEAETVGVAAKLPDALTGGSMVGAQGGGPLVITDGASLSAVTGSWLGSRKADIAKCYVFGGERSMTPRVKSQIEATLR